MRILYIGNKRFSSWSLRPWLVLKHFGVSFEERMIPLDHINTARDIARISPSGRVPCLHDDGIVVWESLAIMEHLADLFPEKNLWPKDPAARATARAISCEMHAGFSELRALLPHDLQTEHSRFDSSAVQTQIDRIHSIWSTALKDFGGPFLFGEFSIADAMFAPVVNRFITYAVPSPAELLNYRNRIRQLPAHQEWIAAAKAETLIMPRYERVKNP